MTLPGASELFLVWRPDNECPAQLPWRPANDFTPNETAVTQNIRQVHACMNQTQLRAATGEHRAKQQN